MKITHTDIARAVEVTRLCELACGQTIELTASYGNFSISVEAYDASSILIHLDPDEELAFANVVSEMVAEARSQRKLVLKSE